ncbi:MAG: cytochrome-c oxidase, cbb3-type subunit III [Alphaproteobacteria bacterium]|nr:cytochrome-c oxidase, cbb3-type subunit III [Alphaproteobacteria bacterium]MCB9975156.1 cytochrome-c oxidase, cbb3-type subunit III [Rhodospirillales bacterium]
MTDGNKKNPGHQGKEIDRVSGVETTGHEWDGLKELNNPAPRWWLWVFYITCIWSVWYWVVYPSWPTLSGATEGSYGWTQYKKLAAEQQEIIDRQNAYLDRFKKASFSQILKDKELYAFAKAGGSAAFKDNCATCHGTGGAGGPGYPNLNDDDWLWGGEIDTIYETILYGIRSAHDDTRISEMPAFGKDELLEAGQVEQVVDYVLSLSGKGGEHHGDLNAGQQIFEENCASCHGEDAKGLRDSGAPNLTDSIWLFGGDRASVYKTVFEGRKGVMPTWVDRLDKQTIRQLAVYVHELGGGETREASASEQAAPMEATPVQDESSASDEDVAPSEVAVPDEGEDSIDEEDSSGVSEPLEETAVPVEEAAPPMPEETETNSHDGE